MKSKKIKKIIGIVSAAIAGIVLVVIACNAIVVLNADRVLVLGYRGLENMFHADNEYYAVYKGLHVRIPKSRAQSYFDKDIDTLWKADREVGTCYYIQCCHSPKGELPFDNKETISHDFDENYFIVVSRPGPDDTIVSDKDEQILFDIATHFYDFDSEYEALDDNWIALTGDTATIYSVEVYINGDDVILCLDENGHPERVYSYKDGKFTYIMNIPDKASFDFVLWKED